MSRASSVASRSARRPSSSVGFMTSIVAPSSFQLLDSLSPDGRISEPDGGVSASVLEQQPEQPEPLFIVEEQLPVNHLDLLRRQGETFERFVGRPCAACATDIPFDSQAP